MRYKVGDILQLRNGMKLGLYKIRRAEDAFYNIQDLEIPTKTFTISEQPPNDPRNYRYDYQFNKDLETILEEKENV